MITLTTPISVTPPPEGRVMFSTYVFETIDYIVTYDNVKKYAVANIKGINRPLLLWTGAAYDAAGQWTDTDVDNRVRELLGNDPAAVLQGLYRTLSPNPSAITGKALLSAVRQRQTLHTSLS